MFLLRTVLAIAASLVVSGFYPAYSQQPESRLEHLVKAAAHLELAGLNGQAAEIRSQIRADALVGSEHLLKQKRCDLRQLQAEISQLEQAMVSSPQILVRIKAVKYEPDNLEKSGFPLVSLRQLLDQPVPTPVVDETGSLVRFIEMLQQQRLIKIIAEPSLVMPIGGQASFFSGGSVPDSSMLSARARTEQDSTFGTRFRCAADVNDSDQLTLKIEFSHSELCNDGTDEVDSEDQQAESSALALAVCAINTEIQVTPGKAVILGGLARRRDSEADCGLIFVLHAERIEHHAGANPPKKPN